LAWQGLLYIGDDTLVTIHHAGRSRRRKFHEINDIAYFPLKRLAVSRLMRDEPFGERNRAGLFGRASKAQM